MKREDPRAPHKEAAAEEHVGENTAGARTGRSLKFHPLHGSLVLPLLPVIH